MTAEQISTRRWDPIVKITHWGVAAVVVCNALVVGEGSIAHIYAGYTLAGLLALRVLWGMIGTRPARFSAFLPSASRALAHLRAIRTGQREHHVSHNPLGALMAYALWAVLAVIIASGIAMAGAPPAIESTMTANQIISGEEHEEEYGEYGEKASRRARRARRASVRRSARDCGQASLFPDPDAYWRRRL